MVEQRPAVHAYLTVESHQAWQTFAEENGVSVTGLIEAIGRELTVEMQAADDPIDVRQDWVRRARRIDAERRRRGGQQ